MSKLTYGGAEVGDSLYACLKKIGQRANEEEAEKSKSWKFVCLLVWVDVVLVKFSATQKPQVLDSVVCRVQVSTIHWSDIVEKPKV